MIKKTPFVLVNASGERIHGDVRYVDGVDNRGVVVILHSFMAFKDWGWFPYVAERIAEAGFMTVIFNFSRNGVAENPNRITDFKAFQRNTISHELEDIRVVLDAVQSNAVGETTLTSGNIVLLGHSRGGGEAIVTAKEQRAVKGLVTWASVATFDRWTKHQKEQWRRLGYLPLARESSKSPLSPGVGLLDDVEKNKEKLDIIAAASRIHTPWLIIHGTEDLLVKFSEGERLYEASDKTLTEFLPLKRVGHLFGGADVTEDSAIHDVVDHTVHWLHKRFKEFS